MIRSGLPPSGQSMAYVSLLHQLFAFPFWVTCVVWLAARSGRTIWSSWTVPLLLLAAPMLIHVLAVGISFSYSQANVGDIIYLLWAFMPRWCLFFYVVLVFLFRLTTLHLRPVEVVTSPIHLTVLSMLLLTTVVAVGLSFDALAYKFVSGSRAPLGVLFNRVNHSIYFIQIVLAALVWFSIAWLFVARNAKRWIGIVGLLAYLIWNGIYSLVIVRLEVVQLQLPSGSTAIGSFYLLSTFAISLLHVYIMFLCVGMMHLAGYRWDIRRRQPIHAVNLETQLEGIPPLLSSTRIGLNPESQVHAASFNATVS